MKKSKLVTVALVTSLSFFGCQKHEKKKDDSWSVQTDTENKEVVQSYAGGSHINPFFWYWMGTRAGSYYHYYGRDRDNYSGFHSSSRSFGSHSVTGGRSVTSRSSSIIRGGFGSHGRGFGISS